MKSDFPTKAIGELCDIVGGGTPSKSRADFFGGNIPWATVRDMKSDWIEATEHSITPEAVKGSATNILPTGTVVIASRVGLGKVCRVSQDTAINQDLRGFVPKAKAPLDTQFLFWWFKSVAHKIVAAGNGATVQGVTLPFLRSLEIPLPPLEEQRRIVAVLDQAFAAIATATANTQKNLTNARELFESSLDSTYKQSDFAWAEQPLGDVCKFVGGSQPPKAVFTSHPTSENIRLVQIRDYKSDRHIVYIPRKLARRFCATDDVMIGRYGPPLFQILRGIDGAYNVALMKAVPDESKISKDYLFYFLRNRQILSYIVAASARAAGQIGLTKETIEPYPIPFPSLEMQAAIVSDLMRIEAATKRIEENMKAKLAALTELKQSLLQKAFAGELT